MRVLYFADVWAQYSNHVYLFLSSMPVYTNLLCGYAYTLFVMDTMYTLKTIRTDNCAPDIITIRRRAKFLKGLVYTLMVVTMLVYFVQLIIIDSGVSKVVNQMNRPTIVVMYGIAGIVSGYFSIYFLIEMKREYGDKFTRPRNRVSGKTSFYTFIRY